MDGAIDRVFYKTIKYEWVCVKVYVCVHVCVLLLPPPPTDTCHHAQVKGFLLDQLSQRAGESNNDCTLEHLRILHKVGFLSSLNASLKVWMLPESVWH